jgi:hypothetical protein
LLWRWIVREDERVNDAQQTVQAVNKRGRRKRKSGGRFECGRGTWGFETSENNEKSLELEQLVDETRIEW